MRQDQLNNITLQIVTISNNLSTNSQGFNVKLLHLSTYMERVDSKYGLPISPELTGNFFRGMSLGDFYGKSRPNPKKIAISSEQFLRWASSAPNDEERIIRDREKTAFALSYGIEQIGGMQGHKDDGHFLNESSTYEGITWWVPYSLERQLILRLAQSVVESGEKPVILDAGCGSGAVTKLLAADGRADTFGVDLMLHEIGSNSLPPIQGAHLADVNLWDTLGVLSSTPETEELLALKKDLLQRVHDRVRHDPVFEHLSIFSASAQVGDPEALNLEVERLQQIAQQRQQESPIDIALCSFMPTTAELTIPIRDGINPKAIVYVRPMNGMSGAGDYYCTELEKDYPDEGFTLRDVNDGDFEPTQVNENTIISYNPGVNYKTVARWVTTWQNNWMSRNGSFSRIGDAEVVIQLRRDVKLRPIPSPVVEQYDFDIEMKNGFNKETEELASFISGIHSANQILSTEMKY